MKVLIAGCGDVGGALGRLLVDDGCEVFGLRRHPGDLPAGIAPLAGDVTDPVTLTGIPRGLDFVVYSVAAGAYGDDAYRAAYVVGVRNVLAVLSGSGQRLRRFIYVSSTGVYGQGEGEWVDEESPVQPRSVTGRRVLEGEGLALGCGWPATVVRFGGIYGPGRNRLIERVRTGSPCADAPPVWTNRIHRDDCAGVLRHLALLEAASPVYVGVDCEPAPECAVMDFIAGRLGRSPPVRAADESARRPSRRCRNTRLLDSGYVFRYPSYREGYAALLEGQGA